MATLIPAEGELLDAEVVHDADGFTRHTRFIPAWDKRHSDPARNYGIHPVELRMTLVGPLGATHFVLYTGWHWIKTPSDNLFPIPADFGYHSPAPIYDGQEPFDCDVLSGGRCYFDGSGLNAQPVYERLLREGDAGVWDALMSYYRDLFESDQVSAGGAGQDRSQAAPADPPRPT